MQEGRVRQKVDPWLPRAKGRDGDAGEVGATPGQWWETCSTIDKWWLHNSEYAKIH